MVEKRTGLIVCQAAQLNRNNDLHVSSFNEKRSGYGEGPRGSSGLTERREGLQQEVNVIVSVTFFSSGV